MRLKRNFVRLFIGMVLALPSWSQVISTVGSSSAWGGPLGVKLDAAGNIYVADYLGHSVYKIDSQANITTIAGKSTAAGNSGDGNAATSALLVGPSAAVVDAAGNMYIADLLDSRIRKVSPTGIITTLVGGGAGFVDGPSASARVNGPLDLALDKAGNLYVVDYFNYRIRKITPSGVVST